MIVRPRWGIYGFERRRGLPPPSEASTLLNGLIAYWELEESGASDRVDAHNGLDLTVGGTVSQIADGVIGNGAGIAAAGNTLITADDPLMDLTGGMSIVSWIRFPTSIPTIGSALIDKRNGTGNFEFRFQFEGAVNDQFIFQTFDVSDNPYSVNASTFGPPDPDEWYMVVGTADNSLVKISVNAGTQDQVAQSAAIPNGNANVRFGDNDFFHATHFDQVGLWDRAITQEEIEFLYNGGVGRSYASL